MPRLLVPLLALAALAVPPALAQDSLAVARPGAGPDRPAPAERFTGSARVGAPFGTAAPGRVSGATVTFEPGARTDWHTHALGQTLVVTAGVGRVQVWGGPVQEVRPGDVVTVPPGAKHWHGAAPTAAMTHVALAERPADGTRRANRPEPRPTGPHVRSSSWVTSPPSWPTSPTTSSTAGSGPTRRSRPATGAWSR